MASEMGFTVPADYREAFRAAVLSDLTFDGKGAVERFRKFSEQQIYGYPEDKPDAIELGNDHRGSLRYIAQTARLILELEELDDVEGDVEIEGKAEAIYHALHELVSKFSGPMSVEALDTLPPEPQKVKRWMGMTEWGLAEMQRVDAAMRADQEEGQS